MAKMKDALYAGSIFDEGPSGEETAYLLDNAGTSSWEHAEVSRAQFAARCDNIKHLPCACEKCLEKELEREAIMIAGGDPWEDDL